MPAVDFIDLAGLLIEAEKEEDRRELITVSFGAWQLIETLKAMFISESTTMPFGEYVRALGITGEETKSKEVSMQEAFDIAKEIADAGRKELHA